MTPEPRPVTSFDVVRALPRHLVVMDVDSTFIDEEVIELLADHAGTRGEVASITEAAMRGELDFAGSLHARVATLIGLPTTVIDEVVAAATLTNGARELVGLCNTLGWPVGLVSGGFVEIVEPLAAPLGITHIHANRLGVSDGLLTGRVTGEVVDAAVKARTLREIAAAEGINMSHTVAVGDGANDMEMLSAAALGIAFCAKPVLREAADVRIDVRDLRLVLDVIAERATAEAQAQ